MSARNRTAALVRTLFVVMTCNLAVGCDTPPPDLRNAAPSVVLVAVRADPSQEPGTMALDLFVRDLEKDPVDLKAYVLRESGKLDEALILATPGHGHRGLHSQSSVPGAWHRVYWDASLIPDDEAISVEVECADSGGHIGLNSGSGTFKRSDGWTILTGSPDSE